MSVWQRGNPHSEPIGDLGAGSVFVTWDSTLLTVSSYQNEYEIRDYRQPALIEWDALDPHLKEALNQHAWTSSTDPNEAERECPFCDSVYESKFKESYVAP